MIGKIFGLMVILSTVSALITGNTLLLGSTILDSTAQTVTLTVTLGGMMIFWCGVMEVLREGGVLRRLARLLRPLVRCFFPDAYKHSTGSEEICANISANLLGLGNASTPLGLAAMNKLQVINPDPSTASGDMITLTVLNTASVSIVPSTVIVMRQSAGSADPFCVVGVVWLCSAVSAMLALILTRLCRFIPNREKR